ncbi:MAG TPA: L-threonylcarbamoyladenylate synthase [Acidimicrobiales bacterium]
MVTPAPECLEAAAEALRSGAAVVVPTDTVYGVAVDPTVPGATQRLFDVKGRRRDTPIAVLVADAGQAWSLAARPVPTVARRLSQRFWPGALTLVVPRAPGWMADIGDDTATVGVRCPAHDLVRRLCRMVGPLATTSANRHGAPPAETLADVVAALGEMAVMIDGGRITGMASTVVDCTSGDPRVLREGAIAATEILR